MSEANTNQPEQQFGLQGLYLKDLSFESPMGAKAFTEQLQPKVNQDVSSKTKKLGDDRYEVVLTVTVQVTSGETTVYLVEVQQAGVFLIKGLENQLMTQLLNTQCLATLFPYAREAIDNVVVKGGFPPLTLPPINFDALFAQALADSKQNGGAPETSH